MMNGPSLRRNGTWFAYTKLAPEARLRLFCVPYAGGSAVIYRHWAKALPQSIELWPIQLPGRGTRANEPPIASMNEVIEALSRCLSHHYDKPFALFGHSMGALISFELAHRLREDYGREPAHLFVSASCAPHRIRKGKTSYNLPKADFIEELRRLKGTPEDVFADQELLDVVLPPLRADFELIQTYKYVPRLKLSCPLTAFGGWADEQVNPQQLAAWADCTLGSSKVHMFPGDHFFLHSNENELVRAISDELEPLCDYPTQRSLVVL